MKIIPILAVIVAFLGAGVGQSKAETTNVVLQINFALTGFSSNGPVHIATKDIIQAIAAANSTNFPANAKLVVISDISSSGGPAFFVRVKSGTNITDTPVSSFISVNSETDEVDVNGVKYSDQQVNVSISDSSGFSISGFGTRKTGLVSGGRGVGRLADKQTVSVTINPASGGGSWNSYTVVLKGSISATAPKVEVVPSGA